MVNRALRVLVVQRFFGAISIETKSLESNDKNVIQMAYTNGQLENLEESVSAPSPIVIFSTTTPTDSPKKRVANANKSNILLTASTLNSQLLSKNHNCCGKKCAKCGGMPPKVEMPVRMTIGKRLKRFGISIKKVFTDKDCALLVMVIFLN